MEKCTQNCESSLLESTPARVISSPSGAAKEDNVKERENSEVKQFFASGGITGYGYGWTDRRGI